MKIISIPALRKALRHELMAEAGWQHSRGVRDESYIYHADNERTSPSDVPAHFGLPKRSQNQRTLRLVFIRAGSEVTTPAVMTERRLLRGMDYEIATYGPLVVTMHLRINQVLANHTWGLIKRAYQATGTDSSRFTRDKKVEDFPSDAAKTLFQENLGTELTASFPKLASKNPVIPSAAFQTMFKDGNTFDAMNKTVLSGVIKGRGL